MTKKTVNISEKIIQSIFFGFLLSLLIVISGHLIQDDWKAMPDSSAPNYGTMGGAVSICSYSCLFNSRHRADCTGKKVYNFDESNPKILSASFQHLSLILIIGIISSILIYIFKTISFKVVKE